MMVLRAMPPSKKVAVNMHAGFLVPINGSPILFLLESLKTTPQNIANFGVGWGGVGWGGVGWGGAMVMLMVMLMGMGWGGVGQ